MAHPLAFDLEVPAHPISIGFVRRSAAALGELCGTKRADVLSLIFTELVTNAIRHAEVPATASIRVELGVDDEAIRGSVRDQGIGFRPDPGGPRPHADGGFGLVIVGRLARDWGVDLGPDGTCVWFVL